MLKKLFRIVIAFIIYVILVLIILLVLLHYNKVESLTWFGMSLIWGIAMVLAWYFAGVLTKMVFD